MKPLYLALALFATLIGSAQTWCPPGAVWHYTLTADSTHGKNGIVEYKYVGDTLLQNVNCKMMTYNFKGTLSPGSTNTVISNIGGIYSYENDNVVYVLSFINSGTPGNFDTVVNFNANIGDKWLKIRAGGICNPRRAIMVIDTGHIIINNINLKKIVTSYTSYYINNNIITTVNIMDTLIEKIMSRDHYMFPIYCEVNNSNAQLDMKKDVGAFLCYQDDTFPSYAIASATDCNNIITELSTLSPDKNNFKIYPNPASGIITIDSELLSEKDARISIRNLLGQTLLNKTSSTASGSVQIDLSPFEKGIYLLQVSNTVGLLLNEKIVKD